MKNFLINGCILNIILMFSCLTFSKVSKADLFGGDIVVLTQVLKTNMLELAELQKMYNENARFAKNVEAWNSIYDDKVGKAQRAYNWGRSMEYLVQDRPEDLRSLRHYLESLKDQMDDFKHNRDEIFKNQVSFKGDEFKDDEYDKKLKEEGDKQKAKDYVKGLGKRNQGELLNEIKAENIRLNRQVFELKTLLNESNKRANKRNTSLNKILNILNNVGKDKANLMKF